MHRTLLFLFASNQPIDRTALWTGIFTAVAIVGSVLAWRQLRSLRDTSRANFANKFAEWFFTTENGRLLLLAKSPAALEFDVIKIKDGETKWIELPYLKVNRNVAEQLKGVVDLDEGKLRYSTFEVDEIAGQLDDLGWYVKRGLIDNRTARQIFSSVVIVLWENPAIKRYVKYRSCEEPFDNLEWLYQKWQA